MLSFCPPVSFTVLGIDQKHFHPHNCIQEYCNDSFLFLLSVLDNFYGTPKPPAEPSALLLNVTDQLLPGARPSSEGKRKRNKSVSNMEKASIEPPEEEEEERPIVNGNGVAVTPGQLRQHSPQTQSWKSWS